jgi:Concanavalin A-like lectin/glucanases superfamily/Domain of unknown function (DUF2341)
MNFFRMSFPAAAGFAGIATLCCLCTRDYDPYTDPSNARAVVSFTSFSDRDTVSIFTTETLQTRIAVRELVDSVGIYTKNNRRNPDTLILHSPFSTATTTYLASFFDTGWIELAMTTFRKNGEKESQEFSLYCRSPLSQPIIHGNYGDSVKLASTPVGDADVAYHWDFGNGIVATSPLPHSAVVVQLSSYGTKGQLWVSDPAGTHPSPKTDFSFELADSSGPKIVCVNLPAVTGDTILTGDTTFYLRLKIWDPAQSTPVCSTKVNGQAFSIKEDPYYISIFGRMDTAVRFFPVVVSAVDNQQFRNTSTHTFYLRFSDTMSHSNGIIFTVNDPSTDSSASMQAVKGILGRIEDYAQDSISVVVKMWLNGLAKSPPDTVHVKLSGTWSFSCSLSVGVNNVRLAAFSMKGDTLAAKTIKIAYDPNIRDTVGPVILEITADGRTVNHFYTPLDSAFVKIIAFDEASGMKSMLINGAAIPAALDGHGFIWYDTVGLAHTLAGNTFAVSAIDNDSNTTKSSFTLFRNSPPVITRTPSFPDRVYAGSSYTDFLVWQDADNDPVTMTKLSGPSSITVYQTGRIDWKPLAADTGLQSVTISLFDGYESVEFSFHATVIGDTTNMPPSVRFATTLADFPATLEVGHDSLSLVLKTINGSGNAPLGFSAALGSGSSVILMRDSVLSWHPVLADTGPQTLVVTVTDRFKRSDTLQPAITVVPPNRPCTLFVSSTIPAFKDGELDLSNATMPETLFFSVHDPDPVIAEQLTARIRWPLSESVMGIDSTRRFILILNPKTAVTKSKDTVQVLVKDKAGHADSLSFFISYVPLAPAFSGSRTIVVNTSTTGVQITGNVLNFPLLVRLDKSFFPFDSAAHGGRDVRFRKSNGTALPYEIESWDSAGGKATLWVRVDTVFVNSSTQSVHLMWGNLNAADSATPHSVFDTAKGFLGVWHMNDASLGQNMNSAQDAFNATLSTSGNSSILLAGDGVISRADSLPSSSFLLAGNLPTPQQVTISAWVYPVRVTANAKIVCKPWTSYTTPYQIYSLEVPPVTTTTAQFHVGLSSTYSFYVTGDNMLPLNVWTHLTGTYDGTTMRLYVNGVMASSTQISPLPAPSVPTNNQSWTIGSWDLTTGEYFSGKIDEVRICKGAFGSDFIKLSYENQRQGSTMVTFK